MLNQAQHEDADKQSTGCWTPPSTLPEATEVDRLLVRATQAAIDAASTEFGSNSDEYEDEKKCDQVAKHRAGKSLSGRVRSFLRSILNGGGSAERDRQNASNSTAAEAAKRKKTGGGGGCTRPRRGNSETRRSATLENVSNTDAATAPKPAEQQQKTENNEQGADAKSGEQQDEQLAPTPPPQPEPEPEPEPETISQYPPIEKPRIFRGGPTTEGHKSIQDRLYSECRVIPISTLYKKVAMVPGRGRLFLSAPSDPRPIGSRMLYDIAYENFRHHSDCNRDFTRAGLKKICSTYCKPSQFRYVY